MMNRVWTLPRFRRVTRQGILRSATTAWFLLQGLGVPVVMANAPTSLTYGELVQKVNAGEVKSVEIDPTREVASVTLKDPTAKVIQVPLLRNNRELEQALESHEVEFSYDPSADNSALTGFLLNVLLIVVVITGLILIFRRSANASNQVLNFGKSPARFQMEAKTGVTFADVAGIEEAKEELQEIVGFLKYPERFTAIGAKIPRGVLLVGPPGTGKTLLAKAIAGEAEVPFFSISGSEFVWMFVGVGASRVRDLFKRAKESAPCIIFIDEIDAVGRQRGVGIGGGNDEREQTLNQLLTELDGFEGNTGVIVVAATNRPDVLDTALLRPGRFDRQVMVDLPNRVGRLGILEVHARSKRLASEVSLEAIARQTPGFSGADLANLLNEAAILTARRRKEEITPAEITDAFDRVTIGLMLQPLLDSKKKWVIAYHEIGHALLTTLLKYAGPLQKVTIIPRSGGVGGFSRSVPNEDVLDSGLYTRAWLVDNITMTLGGRAAEMVVFGPAEISNGAFGDINRVTDLARKMVTLFGMSELGPVALESMNEEAYLGRDMMAPPEYSDEIATQIDHQVRDIIQHCYAEACRILRDNRPLMDRLVELLLDQETIEGEDFHRLVEEFQMQGQTIDCDRQPATTLS